MQPCNHTDVPTNKERQQQIRNSMWSIIKNSDEIIKNQTAQIKFLKEVVESLEDDVRDYKKLISSLNIELSSPKKIKAKKQKIVLISSVCFRPVQDHDIQKNSDDRSSILSTPVELEFNS